MVYRVEEALQVEVYHIMVSLVYYLLRPMECIVAVTAGTEAKAVLMELALIDGAQHLVDGLLD